MRSVERDTIEAARVGRLATADADAHPHVIPICFALLEEQEVLSIVSAIDEKPKSVPARELRRIRDIRSNPSVSLLIDEYSEDWTDLFWLQIRGRASVVEPNDPTHVRAVDALETKYSQYRNQDLADRPVLRIAVGHVVSWGLDHQR